MLSSKLRIDGGFARNPASIGLNPLHNGHDEVFLLTGVQFFLALRERFYQRRSDGVSYSL